MLLDGLMSSPPVSKQTPLPTSVTLGWAGSPQEKSISRGARVEAADPGGRLGELAVAAAAAVGADYAGVDLIRCEDGELAVLEVNSIPAWQGLQRVTPFDIAGALARDLAVRVLGIGGRRAQQS